MTSVTGEPFVTYVVLGASMADLNATCGGMVSLSSTFFAVSGPLLWSVIVYVTSSPT